MGLDSSAFISMLFYVIYGAEILLPFLVRRTTLNRADLLHPYLVISLLLFFYSISTLRSFEANGLAETFEAVSPFSIAKFALACLVGQLGLALGALGGPSNAWHGRQNQENASDNQRLHILTGPALVLAILLLPFYADRLNFINVTSYADSALEWRIDRMQDNTYGIKEVFLREMPIAVILCACTALLLDGKRLVFVRLGAGAVLGAIILTSLFAGLRGQLAGAVAMPLLYFHYRVRNLSLFSVIFIVISGYLLMNALSISRISADPLEMIALLTEQIGTEGYGFLEVSQSGELQTSANLVRLIVGIDTGEDSYRWGAVALSNIVSIVPRVIWPDRPPTGSELFVQVFYPGILESGGGYGSFIFQDPYWDFGFFGVFIFAFGLSWIMRKIYVELIVRRGTSFGVLLYTIVYANLVIAVVRSGVFAGIKGALVTAAPLLLIAMLARDSAHSSPSETVAATKPPVR